MYIYNYVHFIRILTVIFKNVLKVFLTRFMPNKNKLSLSFYSLHFCFNKLKRIFNLFTKTISKHKKTVENQ